MPVTFTTEVPDVQGLSLDASDPESLTAVWDAVLNNGEFQLELRDDDPDGDHPPYELETTVAWDGTLEHTISNILGGEQYSVRIRGQTEYATGEWLTVEEVTKLLASDGVTLSNVTETSADLDWTINNDFRGSHQVYRRRTDYEYDDDGRLVGSVADDIASYVDDTLTPGREYEYTVRTLTQWQYADSPTATTSTTSIGLEDRAVPPQGWYVEIDHPSGTVLTPQILDATRRPAINDLPEVIVTVPPGDQWQAADLEDAPARVWYDGTRLPIEEFVEPTDRPGGVGLRLRGGIELDQYVDDIEFLEREAQDGVAEVLDEYTDYEHTVDDPQTSTEEDVIIDGFNSDSSWEEAIEDEDDDAPLRVFNGLQFHQTAWWGEAEDLPGDDGGTVLEDTPIQHWSAGETVDMEESLHDKTLSFETEYPIPADDLEVAFRFSNPDGNPDITLEFDNTELITYSEGGLTETDSQFDMQWRSQTVGNEDSLPDVIEPGTHSFELSIGANSPESPRIQLDGLYVYDSTYSYDLPSGENTAPDGVIDGAQLYPDEYVLEIGPIASGFQIVGGSLDVEMTDLSGVQQLRISNDGGETWIEASNAAQVSGDFAAPSNEIRAQVRFGRYTEDPDTTPTGDASQVLEELTLRADLDDTPLLIDKFHRGTLLAFLRETADDGNWIFEAQWDDDVGGISIEWTQPGLRQSTADPDLVDYEVSKDASRSYDRAVIFGSARTVRNQRFQRDEYGLMIGLGESWIVQGSETVYDPTTEETFELGTDYEMRWPVGGLAILADGDMTTGTEYAIDYEYKVRGEYEVGASNDPETVEEDVPGAMSSFECDQIALGLIKELQEPPISADVTVPRNEVGFNLTETIDIDQLPVGRELTIRGIDHTPEDVQLRLGSRRSKSEVLQALRERVGRVARRV